MTKVLIAGLVAIVVAAIFGIINRDNPWTLNQSLILLGWVGLVLAFWWIGLRITRGERTPKK